MNTKLYVLGAVLGTAPALLPVACTPWEPSSPGREQEPRGGTSRRVERPSGGGGAGVLLPTQVPAGVEPGVPTHPCELITEMKVPCDASTEVCEYTYWQCPQSVDPLRA
ncbi:hypothetical protein JRI60_08295 [Archangium violaceum]|uniref:hypothetical protein n=1 Tax=Archangium violaceum TaxID=83451 RepID=UPI001951D2F2|nr:hypothetical protein [Archangium violaceum]QRN99013.1 hypothetical protein JRI60_08295 [Archangium violaceum]